MRWFEKTRLEWIGQRLAAKGHIQRKDLMQKFDITEATASKDLNNFLRERPDLMEYNLHTKRYEMIGPLSQKDL